MTAQFASTLNRLLKGAGLSGNKLAERLEVDPSQVARWRKGEGIPRPENIRRLADIFGVARPWLFALAYPSADRPESDIDPELAAFISEIEAGWRAMENPAEREIATRGTRALWAVPPIQRKRRVTKSDGNLGRPKDDTRRTTRPAPRPYLSQSVASMKTRYGYQPATV